MAGTANISAMICNKDELAPTLVSLIISLIICSFAKPGIFPPLIWKRVHDSQSAMYLPLVYITRLSFWNSYRIKTLVHLVCLTHSHWSSDLSLYTYLCIRHGRHVRVSILLLNKVGQGKDKVKYTVKCRWGKSKICGLSMPIFCGQTTTEGKGNFPLWFWTSFSIHYCNYYNNEHN